MCSGCRCFHCLHLRKLTRIWILYRFWRKVHFLVILNWFYMDCSGFSIAQLYKIYDFHRNLYNFSMHSNFIYLMFWNLVDFLVFLVEFLSILLLLLLEVLFYTSMLRLVLLIHYHHQFILRLFPFFVFFRRLSKY